MARECVAIALSPSPYFDMGKTYVVHLGANGNLSTVFRRRLPSGATAEACLAVFLADHGTALREEPQLGSTAGSLVPPLAASDSPAVAQEQQPPALVPLVEGPGCAPVGVRFGSGRRPREAGSPNPHATGS